MIADAVAPGPGLHDRRYRAGLILVALMALLALALYLYYGGQGAGSSGFPLDDSWIHLQIAHNVAAGQGWSFNPGEPTGASTAPLWVALLAPLFWLPGDVTVWVKALGCLLYLIDVLLVADVARLATGDRRVAVAAGLLAAWQSAFVWGALSGMEVTLYLLLFLMSLRSLLLAEQRGARSAYASTAWLVVAGWARPELWAFLPVTWGYLAWRRREVPLGQWWVHGGIALLGVGAFALFNLSLWGHALPSTYYAKTSHLHGADGQGLLASLFALLDRLVINVQGIIYSQNPILALSLGLVAIAAWRGTRKQRLHLALLLLFVLVAIASAALLDVGNVTFQTYRRSAYALACMNILVAIGAMALWDTLWRAGPIGDASSLGRRRLSSAGVAGPVICVVAMVVAMQADGLRRGAQLYANDVRSINQGDVAAGQWLADNTSADVLVGANDIGAVAYFGKRRVFDVIGLASPESIPVMAQTRAKSPERDQRIKKLLVQHGVDYAVIFPFWFPIMAQDPTMIEVTRFTVQDPTALAGDEVVIYRLKAPE